MADIRINQLPAATGPNAPASTDNIAIDGTSTRRATIQQVVDTGAPIATQTEAQAGTNATKRMTPLTTKQSIEAEIGVTLASADQGAKADSAVQPEDLGNSASRNVGTTSGTVAAGNDSRIVSANNLLTGMSQETPYLVDARRYTNVIFEAFRSSYPNETDWIASGPATIHGRASNNLNGVHGEVIQGNTPGDWSFPCGVIGTGILRSAGNSVFGIFARAQGESNGTVTNELNTFNYVGGPPGDYPPNRGFGINHPMPITLTLGAGGDFPSFCAIDIVREGSEPQTYYTGIYTNADAITDFGILIDSSDTQGPKTSGYLKNKLSTADSTVLTLQNTNNAYNANAKLIKALAPGGGTILSVSPTGKTAIGTDAQAAPTQLNVTGNDTVRGVANTSLMAGVDLSAGSTIGAAVQIGALNGNTPFVAASRYGASATTPSPLVFLTDAIERLRLLATPGNGIGIKTPVPANSYANDAAAAAAGIQVGEWYRNGSQIMIRVT